MELSTQILPRLLDGSANAWVQFVHASAPIVWGQVRRCFGRYGAMLDPTDLEDVSQDVYMRLSHGDFAILRRYDPNRAKLSTFLGVIAHSASVDFLRKRRVNHHDIDDPSLQLTAPEPPSYEDTGSLMALLPATLISERQRLILTKLYDEDLDVEEVADLLNVEAQTVRSAKHKALSKIRKHFDENPHLKEAA